MHPLLQKSKCREHSSAGSEHLPYKQRVTGSNPVAPTTESRAIRGIFFYTQIMKVELEKILSVSGKPGIFKLVAGGKSVIIAESLVDGKRLPIHPSQRVSSLSDISIFTIEEDVPLKDVFTKMKEHYNGQAADYKSEPQVLRGEIVKFLPTYDAERVYDSDIRKLFQWFNILQAKDMLEFVEEEAEEGTDAAE